MLGAETDMSSFCLKRVAIFVEHLLECPKLDVSMEVVDEERFVFSGVVVCWNKKRAVPVSHVVDAGEVVRCPIRFSGSWMSKDDCYHGFLFSFWSEGQRELVHTSRGVHVNLWVLLYGRVESVSFDVINDFLSSKAAD